jgi:G:T-mismatch repair DNA endonuclease (very short patch repair protein)
VTNRIIRERLLLARTYRLQRAKRPKSKVRFWAEKMETNKRRDDANYARLVALGWRVVIIGSARRGPLNKRAALKSSFAALETSHATGGFRSILA